MSLQRIAMVVTAGLISQTVANIARSIFTDDDWDEIWTIGGYAKATALAPLQGLFLWGTALDIGLSMILGAKWWMAPRDPAIEAMSRAYQAGKHIEDIVDFAHPEEMAKEWGHITRSFTLAAAIPGVSQAGAAMTAVPAAALNLVQQMVAGYQKATEEE